MGIDVRTIRKQILLSPSLFLMWTFVLGIRQLKSETAQSHPQEYEYIILCIGISITCFLESILTYYISDKRGWMYTKAFSVILFLFFILLGWGTVAPRKPKPHPVHELPKRETATATLGSQAALSKVHKIHNIARKHLINQKKRRLRKRNWFWIWT